MVSVSHRGYRLVGTGADGGSGAGDLGGAIL